MDAIQPVVVSLNDLVSGRLPMRDLVEAFGPESLGILIVRDLPERFSELRRHVLSNSSYLANLDADKLKQLERPEANYKIGWSRGTEKFPGEATADTLKGSYFVNCTFHSEMNSEIQEEYAQFLTPNVWPKDDIPDFESSFKDFCNLILDVAALVAGACDGYAVEHVEGYTKGYLENLVKTSDTSSARLLHYFPPPTSSSLLSSTDKYDGKWCAQHIDSCALTALTSAMFVDEKEALFKAKSSGATDLEELNTCPDPEAGLYIRNRNGKLVKISIPKDSLAFQTGETLQVVTKGKFQAVPHLVRGCSAEKAPSIARNTLAIFCQPSLNARVGDVDYATFARSITARNLNNAATKVS